MSSKGCAYCGRGGPFTREHLFPEWLNERFAPLENTLQYLLKVNGFVDGDLTVKDVCRECNSGPLSILDDYVRGLYDAYFRHFVRAGESVLFKYQFNELARWLLKVLYNSARVHSSEPSIFRKWLKYTLCGMEKPEGFTVFLRIVIPHKLTSAEAANLPDLPESVRKAGELVPDMVRIAKHDNPKVQRYEREFARYRTVALNSYYFHVLVPKSEQYSRPFWRRTLREFQSSVLPEAYRLNAGTNETRLFASHIDFFDAFGPTILEKLNLFKSQFGTAG